MSSYRWWHALLKHRMRCDIDPYRMVTVCDCGETWVDLGRTDSAWARRYQ